MRIGVSIPDELLQRLRSLDPETNVSEICREAIRARCATQERVLAQVGQDLTEADITRFSGDRLMEPDWVGYALEDARDWVRAVDQEDWDELFYRYEILQSQGNDVNWLAEAFPLEGVKFMSMRITDNREWFLQQLRLASGPDAHDRAKRGYSQIWLRYVNEVRRKQLELFDSLVETEIAKREARWAEIALPEVPPQLVP